MISRPVVSNTTPLINLVGIGLLDLLPQLYGSIWLPRAVVREYEAKAAATDPILSGLPWITVVEAVSPDPTLPKLGPGETAAISLAKSIHARFVLIDEFKARRIASVHGLVVVGTLAVLVRAKDGGLIPGVKPYIEMMQTQGRRLSEALISRILQEAGE